MPTLAQVYEDHAAACPAPLNSVPSGAFIYDSREGSATRPFARAGFSFGRMNTARHRAALLVLSLRAFHHSTNIGSGIDLIDDLEVGENLPRRKLFDFLLVQTVEPIKERPLVRRQFRMLFGARHGDFTCFG